MCLGSRSSPRRQCKLEGIRSGEQQQRPLALPQGLSHLLSVPISQDLPAYDNIPPCNLRLGSLPWGAEAAQQLMCLPSCSHQPGHLTSRQGGPNSLGPCSLRSSLRAQAKAGYHLIPPAPSGPLSPQSPLERTPLIINSPVHGMNHLYLCV